MMVGANAVGLDCASVHLCIESSPVASRPVMGRKLLHVYLKLMRGLKATAHKLARASR